MGVVDMQQEIIQDPDLDSDFPEDIRPPIDGGGEQYRTILEIWSAVLKPSFSEKGQKVRPQWATRIVTGYPEVRFKDMDAFQETYYSRVQSLAAILNEVIATDDECLKRISAEEDAQFNGLLYRQVITDWQKQFLLWEMAWDCTDPEAAIDLASIAEVHKMFFDELGLISLLDQIDLQFTDADREALAAELQVVKDAADAG